MLIPDWDIHGVVPPIRPGEEGHSPDRAPYRTTMEALCLRFGTSPERIRILRGLLDSRSALETAGLSEGFQWINGSFLEDVETIRGRSPADVDVVTFVNLGDPARQQQLRRDFPRLFSPSLLKADYRVDGYYHNTGLGQGADEVRRVSYWYSMWSHRRGDGRWKGFVEVPLDSGDDALARAYLAGLGAGAGGSPAVGIGAPAPGGATP